MQAVSGAARARLRRSPTLRRVVVNRRHRGIEEADRFVASYPRSGSTWLRFLLGELLTGAPVDFQELERVSPSVGLHAQGARLLRGGGRLIKTHESWRPEYRRGVYVVRDVRDVVVSWYRITRTDPDRLAGFDDFVADFATGRSNGYGRWEDHVRAWTDAAARQPGIEVFHYEELARDPVAGVAAVSRALGIETDDASIRRALQDNTRPRMVELSMRDGEFLRRSFGHVGTGSAHEEATDWTSVLGERHLTMLAPAAEVMRGLGYGWGDPARRASPSPARS